MSNSALNVARGLRAELQSRQGLFGPYQWGVVSVVHASPNTIDAFLDGSATLISGIYCLSSYAPKVNDVVLIARLAGQSKGSRIALGTFGNPPALGTLGYAQITANQTPIVALADITGLSITVTTGIGRRIRISLVTNFFSSVNDDTAQIYIVDTSGPTQLTTAISACTPANSAVTVHASVVIQPSAGSHTYKAQAVRNLGTGNLTCWAGATFPAFILAEDIGT